MHLSRNYCHATWPVFATLLFTPMLGAADIPIRIAGFTETQIAISYTATGSGSCTVAAVDNNNGPVVADVDPTKFANANTDLSRTVANGFRWPTIVSGQNRTVFIGGHDEIKQGLDGKWYSTALQAYSAHTITVTCNGGADSGTSSAQTANVPVASYYPELPIPAAGAPLGVPQPTIDWADRTKKYIDPITGVLLERVTGGADNFDDTNPYGGTYLTPVLDVNGSGQWTNANNFVTAASSLASTNAVNAPLFAAVSFNPPNSEYFTDYLVTPYGSGTGSAVAEWCISTDSGQSCANYTPIDVSFTSSAHAYPVIPSSTPSSNFSGWGGMRVAFGNYDLQNQASSGWTVSASGSTVTIDNTAIYPGFNLDRKAGSKFYLTACTSGTMLTVSSVIDTNTIKTVESGLNLSHCNYQDMSVGIRVILKSGGSLNVSFQMAAWGSRGFGAGSNGAYYPCSRTKVTDIQVDCDGVTHNPPLSGYLCYNYLLQDNGRVCQQSNGYNVTVDIMGQQFLYTSANTYIGKGALNGTRTWNVQHRPNDYTEYPSDPHHSIHDNYIYSDISNTNPITAQIIAAGGTVATALASGLFPPMGIDQLFDDGNGGVVAQYRSTVGPNTANAMCLLAWATEPSTNTLIKTLAMYGSYPFASAACHFTPDGGGGYSVINPGAESGQLGPIFFSPGTPLGGPFWSHITSIHQQGSTYNNWSFAVSAASAGPPVVLTAVNSDLANIRGNSTAGTPIACSGATGSWTGLNGSFYARTSGSTINLFTDPQGVTPANFGSGALTGSVACTTAPPLYALRILAATNNGGNARMTLEMTSYYTAFWPSGQMVIRDGDPVTFTSGNITGTKQYYAKASSAPTGQFDVFTDAALTQPAKYGAPDNLSTYNSAFVVYAETCPDPATISLPGPMYEDTGFGTTGNQKVRCVTFLLTSEPESDYPAAGENAHYPPPSSSVEASNPKKSMLHQINVGDAFSDVMTYPTSDPLELFYVLKVDRTGGENAIKVTCVRGYGDDPIFFWRGQSNGPTHGYGMNHFIGWGAWQQSAVSAGLVALNSSNNIYFTPTGSHADLVSGALPNTVTKATTYLPGADVDDIVNMPASTLSTSSSRIHNGIPTWNGGTAYAISPAQSYPSKRTIAGQAAPPEMLWKTDWMAMNPAIGNPQNNGDDIGWGRTLANIRGTNYDSGSSTTIVWKIQPIGSINIKLAPVLVHNLPHAYYADKSGPGSLITDADAGKFCIAYTVGECRPGSAQWDVFFAGSGFFNWPACRSNEATLGAPCAFGVWPGAGWAVQARMTPVDTNGTGVRRLTQAFWLPPNHYSFSNWVASPDGKWGFFVPNPMQQRPRKQLYEGSHEFVMKLPPWPHVRDAVDRTTYVPVPVRLPAKPGESVRIAFGYGENGDAANLYCTTRQEACWTSAAATPSNPFVFASEAQQKAACTSGCTVSIPAIPGRILFYQVEHTSGLGISKEPLQAIAIP